MLFQSEDFTEVRTLLGFGCFDFLIFRFNHNICFWVFIVHATSGVQQLGCNFMKKLFACGFLTTDTGQSIIWGSSTTWLGFHFLFPQASEQVWDFPLLVSLKQSPAPTKTSETPALQTQQRSQVLDQLVLLLSNPLTHMHFLKSCAFFSAFSLTLSVLLTLPASLLGLLQNQVAVLKSSQAFPVLHSSKQATYLHQLVGKFGKTIGNS